MTRWNEDSLPTYKSPQGGGLSDQMIADYREAGVLILEDFVSVADCRALRERAMALLDAWDPAEARTIFSTTEQGHLSNRYFLDSGDKIRFFLEAEAFDEDGRLRQSKEDSLNKIGHAMHDLDPVFERFSHTPELAQLASDVGLADPVVIQSMYILKPPRIGSEVVCHQDSTFIYTEPESCVGFWFAIDDATTENGCLYFMPGAHKLPLKTRSRRVEGDEFTTDLLDSRPWPDAPKVAAEARAGTLVVFHGRAPHLSGANHSDKPRHAFTLHAIDRQCRYPADNWLQRGEDLPLRGFQ